MARKTKLPGFFTWMLPTLLLAILALAFARWQTTLSERHLHDLGEKTAANIALAASRDMAKTGALSEALTLAAESVGLPRVRYVSITMPGTATLEFGDELGQQRLAVHAAQLPEGGSVAVGTADLGWVSASPLLVAAITGTAILLTLRLALYMRRREHDALVRLKRLARDIDTDTPETSAPRFEDLQSALEELATRVRDFRSDVRDELDRSTAQLRTTLDQSRGKNLELETSRHEALAASKAKSEFLASISHEVRTPVDAILGYKHLLGETPLDDRQQSYLNAIEQAAENLLDILDDVLNLSRIEAGKLSIHEQPFSLRENIDSIAQMLAPSAYRKGLDFVRQVDAEVPETVSGDPLRVRQVLVNLLTNAIKFTRIGHVRIAVRLHRLRGGRAVIDFAVEDTGIGIDEADLDKLFEPFSRSASAAEERGTGLGLVITKRLCEAMDGTISVASVPGRGSTFSARLPLTLLQDAKPAQSPAALEQQSILIWSPQVILSDWVVQCLSLDGATVTRVCDATELSDKLAARDWALTVLVIGQQALGDAALLAQLRSGLRDQGPRLCLVSTSSRAQLRKLERLFGSEALPAHTAPTEVCERIAAIVSKRATPPGVARPLAGQHDHVLDGMHLLVAEDNRFSQDYLRTLLSRSGATVDVCGDGSAACELIGKHDYDLVLMDVRMPGCDGPAAMRRLLAGGQPLPPVIGLTAAQTDCDTAREAGMTDCLVKPVRAALLLDYIARQRAPASPAAGLRSELLDDEMRDELRLELPRYARRLHEQRTRRDFAAMLEQAHRINGAAALCGFDALRNCAAALESDLHRNATDNIDAKVDNVLWQIDAVCATLGREQPAGRRSV